VKAAQSASRAEYWWREKVLSANRRAAFIGFIKENCVGRAQTKGASLVNFCRRQASVFTAAYLLTLVVYTYLFTTIIFTDHTFSNAWLSPYPSFRTTVVARWFADFLNYLVGGAGVQSFQMAIGAGIQAINGILFAILLGLNKRLYVFLSAAFICLHPAFLDYYAFTKDHIAFTFGDTLAILGVLALDRVRNCLSSVFSATTCFVLTIATHQPKIALIALLLLIWCIRGAAGLGAKAEVSGRSPLRHYAMTFLLPAGFTFLAAAGLYFLSERLVLIAPDSAYMKINDFVEFFQQIVAAYRETFLYFTLRVDYLPVMIRLLPILAVTLGLTILTLMAWRRNVLLGLTVLMLVGLIPLALQLSFIINNNTEAHAAGRILAPQAYCLLFFIACLWLYKQSQQVATVLAAIFVYYFAIIGTQETGELAMRHIFNVGKINRIVAKLEMIIRDTDMHDVPVVVIGYLEPDTTHWNGSQPAPMRKFANELYGSEARSEVFNVYRQDEILNFFLGQIGLTVVRPTQAQVDAAIASQWGRRPWPASDAVYLHNGVVVILLQSYGPNVPVTVPREQFGGNPYWGL
jgi:hypothetical protein